MTTKVQRPGYTMRQTSKNTFVFRSRGDFDLRNAPELQALGLEPPPTDEKTQPDKEPAPGGAR